MAMKIGNQGGIQSLLKDGFKSYQGLEEAVFRNINACREMCEIIKSSFGPNGMNKLVVNYLDKLFLTNDAGTILQELEVEHPAAKVLLLAAIQQKKEIGDSTNLVVTLAGEMLAQAEELLRLGLKPSVVIEGFELGYAKALEILDSLSIKEADASNEAGMHLIVESVLSSKQYGMEKQLGRLVVEACTSVIARGAALNADHVRCVKIMGGSIHDSRVINGLVFGREAESRLHRVTKAKIAVYTCPINISRTETKGTVLIHGAKEMLEFSRSEESILEAQIKAIADSGVKVLVTGDSIGEMMLHFIDRYNLMAVKVLSKFDLRRLCKAIGATPLARLGAPTAEEAGHCDVVETVEIGSERCTILRQESEESRVVTIVLRGSTQNRLDDLERAIEDAVNAVKAATKDNRLLAGAGAVEIELSRQLTAFADLTPGVTQYSLRKFAEVFEVVPRILASNAGMDAAETVAKLNWSHAQGHVTTGVDIESQEKNGVRDILPSGPFDLLNVKRSAINLAVNAALTVLHVDQIIMSKPAGGPKPKGAVTQDEDD